jgi:predicted SnoaL-like aldol condensation-catalyzing enzyme
MAVGEQRAIDTAELAARYLADVYGDRNPEAARRYLADECVRHGHGKSDVVGIDANVERIAGFQSSYPEFACTASQIFGGPGHAVLLYDLDFGDGREPTSAVEVFKIVDGRIVENWNTVPTPGAWG